jgi:hypothetical protein
MEIIEERTIGLPGRRHRQGLSQRDYGFAAIALFMCVYYHCWRHSTLRRSTY